MSAMMERKPYAAPDCKLFDVSAECAIMASSDGKSWFGTGLFSSAGKSQSSAGSDSLPQAAERPYLWD